MPFCPKCGSEFREGAKFCTRCGASLKVETPIIAPSPPALTLSNTPAASPAVSPAAQTPITPNLASGSLTSSSDASSTLSSVMAVVTTAVVPGFRIKSIAGSGVVTAVVVKARGGVRRSARAEPVPSSEGSVLNEEFEKGRIEAIERLKSKARNIGANAIIGLALEISEIESTVLLSATGTAVVVEPQ